MFQSIVNLLLVLTASFLQTTSLILVFGIKPNIAIAIFAVLAHFEKKWPIRSILVLISALVLKFSPAITWLEVIYLLTVFLVMALVDYLPWRKAVNSIAATALGSAIISLTSLDLSLIIGEIILNVGIASILFLILEHFYGKKETSKNRL